MGIPERFYDHQLINAFEFDLNGQIKFPLTSKKTKVEAYGIGKLLLHNFKLNG